MHDLTRRVEVDQAREYDVELRPHGTARLVGRLPSTIEADACFSVSAWLEKPAGGGGSLWRGGVAKHGRFELDGLEADRWKVFLHESGPARRARRTGTVDVDLAAGAEVTVDVPVTGP